MHDTTNSPQKSKIKERSIFERFSDKRISFYNTQLILVSLVLLFCEDHCIRFGWFRSLSQLCSLDPFLLRTCKRSNVLRLVNLAQHESKYAFGLLTAPTSTMQIAHGRVTGEQHNSLKKMDDWLIVRYNTSERKTNSCVGFSSVV